MAFVASPITYNSPSVASQFPTPTPSPPPSAQTRRQPGLLIPTDRLLEDLEGRWLPRLGRLKVDREVVVHGYSLYALRTWYLSRTHWSQTIVTQTGKPNEHISAYVIIPDPELPERVGALELATAIEYLASETRSQQRKTEHGILLITTPSAFGQDIFSIPGGDLREARPFLIVNTDIRRLGCGGRAAMAMERPLPPVRRKLYELYRLPQPPTAPLSRTTSPSNSPNKNTHATSNFPSPISPMTITGGHPIYNDTFTLMLVELVRLVQGALALWGFFGDAEGEIELDGLFCDDTKKGIFAWRKAMGMEHEESMRLEKETSGGCIDPKTLAVLLSSVTSVRYQLAALDVEKVPKDPFGSTRRFLIAWNGYLNAVGRGRSTTQYLTVSSLRALHMHYLSERTRSPSDALKVHRMLFSGVASATSSIQANLKGGSTEDTPLRKREHHHYYTHSNANQSSRSLIDETSESGVKMIIPEGEVGVVAPPDVITSDLDAYVKGILKSREKDWDVMGARRVAGLWQGRVDLGRRRGREGSVGRADRGVLKKKASSGVYDEGEVGTKGAFERVTTRTGQAIKGGFGLVSRKNTNYETSDSETGGGGPGPSSLKTTLMRRKQSAVPTVIEPDVEEAEEQLDRFSASPSPTTSRLHVDQPFNSSSSKPSFLTAGSRAESKRPSIMTAFSGMESEVSLPRHPRFPDNVRRGSVDELGLNRRAGAGARAEAWRERGRATAMLRTSSDGADVVVEEGGLEWEVVNPHGTGKGHHEAIEGVKLSRRHSLQDRIAYRDIRLSPAENLAVDVEMCAIVLELRRRERELAVKVKTMKMIEDAVFAGTQDLIDTITKRRSRLNDLTTQAQAMDRELHKAIDDIDEDEQLQWVSKKIQFYLSEEMSEAAIKDDLMVLRNTAVELRKKREDAAKREKRRRGLWALFGY